MLAREYLNAAEDYGYSPHICGYVKADVAMQLRGGEHPMGRIPKPSIAVYTNACNTYIKWAEIWERMYHIPIFTAAKRCEPGLDEQVAYVKALDEAGIPYFVSEFEESMTSFDHLQIQLETFVENLLFA